MTNRASTKTEVLDAVVARLIDQVSGLNSSTCFISCHDDPPEGARHDYYVLVTPLGGRFDDSAQSGGGSDGIHYEGTIAVRVFARTKLDRVGHADSMLTDSSRGLFKLEHEIVKALAGHDLQNPGGDSLLSRYLWVVSDDSPRYREATKRGDLEIQFGVDFLWDNTQ